MKVDLRAVENRVMSQLKDFQVATVNRVFELYESGQNRVLVADEVGLGKTIVARGVIAKTARFHHENGDPLFKVVYVCSNQNIATQNINKLKVYEDITIDGVSDTRLSMQHLKIFEQENDQDVLDNYIQLIPLTPATSFSMTSGSGSQRERALIFALLRRISLFEPYVQQLEVILKDQASKGWEGWAKEYYEARVVKCDIKTKGTYVKTMTSEITKYVKEHSLMDDLRLICVKIKENNNTRVGGTYNLLYRLRMMFARISVDLLCPDIVIMDEFQRFKMLIAADESTESGILAQRFLKSNDTKVLLLSATPYKLYNTLEEINESGSDEHYSEFLQVMDFLFDDEVSKRDFQSVWQDYSMVLRESDYDKISILVIKSKAEASMYKGVCRTERMAEMNTTDIIDDKGAKENLAISKEDIQSYVEMETLIKEIGISGGVPVEYTKSSPYLLSFMMQYQLKKKVEKYFSQPQANLRKIRKNLLWLERKTIKNYDVLPRTNARLELLKQKTFENNGELLLWIPPSKPYYELGGVFEAAKDYSKVLVFSAWEMVPRMIATMISYESERRTAGKLGKKTNKNSTVDYFLANNKRFPVSRLRFNVELGIPRGMSMFCLYYPSKTLADLYDSTYYLNQNMTLKDIKIDIRSKIELKLAKYREVESGYSKEDDRWYYIAPLLFDDSKYINEWFDHGSKLMSNEILDQEDIRDKGFQLHLDKLKSYYNKRDGIELGRMPNDLIDVLTMMAIASPAICAYRSLGSDSLLATQLAKILINQFNKPESTAIVELACEKKLQRGHWKNVLSYCEDGNLQAVFDEYVHLIMDLNGLNQSNNKYKEVHKLMLEAMKTHAASYVVDTFDNFQARVKGKKRKPMTLRTHYAVGFSKGASETEKTKNRRESIRNSFNSPFRPFVLATTSIGQEGLDFHYYCRRIMHWNLPSNAIDLEQREGRINRFKSHAIRRSIANNYIANDFKEDIWKELFELAQEDYKNHHSELVPFWCLPDNQSVKIERIVPSYPFSKDVSKYNRLIQILAHYRLTLGQARQEELLEHIFTNVDNPESLKDLFINLSPYYR